MTPQHRLKQALEYLKDKYKITYEGIAEKLEYRAPNYFSDMISGRKPISGFFLEALEFEYSISKIWIEKGEGVMINEETVANEVKPNKTAKATGISQIEINTSGKKLFIAPQNKNEIQLLNALLAEKEERQKESEQRAEKAEKRADRAEQEKNRLLSILESLTPVLQITKRTDDKSEGTTSEQ